MKNVGFVKKNHYILFWKIHVLFTVVLRFTFPCTWAVLESCKCSVWYISYVSSKNTIFDNGLSFVAAFLDTDINGTPNELESLMILEHQDVYSVNCLYYFNIYYWITYLNNIRACFCNKITRQRERYLYVFK